MFLNLVGFEVLVSVNAAILVVQAYICIHLCVYIYIYIHITHPVALFHLSSICLSPCVQEGSQISLVLDFRDPPCAAQARAIEKQRIWQWCQDAYRRGETHLESLVF